jgi:hypothetical protein
MDMDEILYVAVNSDILYDHYSRFITPFINIFTYASVHVPDIFALSVCFKIIKLFFRYSLLLFPKVLLLSRLNIVQITSA